MRGLPSGIVIPGEHPMISFLPSHLSLVIEHQPHLLHEVPVEEWLKEAAEEDLCEILEEDRLAMISTGEVWMIQWYPKDSTLYCAVAAATLERALELAGKT